MGNPQYKESTGKRLQDETQELVQRFGRLNTLDDLIRLRAADATQDPILAYPKSHDAAVEYEYFTGEDLDCMIDHAVCGLVEVGFKPPKEEEKIVALLTLSDMDMVVTFFALSRLGYTVMMLSPRLSGAACVSLLNTVSCDTIMYGQTPSIRATLGEILRQKLVTVRPIIQRASPTECMDGPSFVMFQGSRNGAARRQRTALILHSSGSTGTPKPLYLSHQAIMTHPLRGPGLTSFNTLPWYHLHGLSTAFQAMYMRKVAYMWDASLPLTTTSVVAALEAAKPESVQGVPYLLQLLVDSDRGLEALRLCKLVTYGGSACPDDLGDRLIAEGVKFGGYFGLTEAGLVAESVSRPAGDPHWNYMRFFDNLRPYIWMKPISDDLYECVYLEGHPALTASNSDDPPGSYHSRDVFTPHPEMRERWKYVTRLDDRITLLNGEKVLPLPIEGTIRQSALIDEAVVVGVNRTAPGLLVFRSEAAKTIPDAEFLDRIWPNVEDANSCAEQFSQISRDMICVLPYGSSRPQTDKGSIIRAQVYASYADVIDGLYTRYEGLSDGTLELDTADTETYLMKLCQNELGLSIPNAETMFFAAGVDSLKAIQLRRLVLRNFRIQDSKAFAQNVVFEAGNISRLAELIHAAQAGRNGAQEDHDSIMQHLIDKYSSFKAHIPVPELVKNDRGVILTGATGSIGAHTLHQMLYNDTVSVVYCLTRRDNPKEAILKALEQKGLSILPYRTKKIIALKSDLDRPDLGLTEETIEEMRQCVSLIVHTAWPVNFNLPLSTFTPHITGLSQLINFSLSVHMPTPAVMLFCSSISTALASSADSIDERPISDLSSALSMGYARSKLVGERIISNARKSGARAYSLRIGQVSGHSKKGLWNDSEAIPLMLRSALTLKALPELDMDCSWLPADKLACSIMEIARVCSSYSSHDNRDDGDDSVYNLCNPHTFTWSAMLNALRQHGYEFQTVPFDDWLEKLRQSEGRGEELQNPAVKLVDHYKAMYGGNAPKPKIFRTDKAERDSETLRNGRLRIIQDGILARPPRLAGIMDAPAKIVKKRIRKPRGRGLRTNTGCLTCRTRHKKCDERKPRCGPCTNSDRDCVYPGDTRQTLSDRAGLASPASNSSRIQHILCSPQSAPPGPVAPTLDYDATSGPSPETHNILDPELVALYPDTRPPDYSGSVQALPSAQSSESVTPDVNLDHASARWLNLLATDAAQAGDFSLPASTPRTRLSRGSVSHYHDHASTAPLYSPQLSERQAWQADSDIALSKHEAALFRRFAEHIALSLDLFDCHKHFSNYATRLALRNVGLMKAILALSARYSSLPPPTHDTQEPTDPNEAIQFYYETLHYVSTALQYNSYKHSEELLATAIVVSTYEMLDASEHNSNWQRHLKGVFWIQRSQDVNGASGGLRQAVWWAWLRQDLWAAFREHRRCFSFWQPIVDYPDLSEDELACRSVYLLSQAVNYCTEPPPDPEADVDPEQIRLRTERGNELMDMLERWRSFSAGAFKAFPSPNREEVHGWTPIWIHPPAFGVALQVYSFAKILVCLHRPVTTGFAGYRTFQKILTDAVATICGIAIELTDPSCQIISAQCLFGAGLCVQSAPQQEAIISLIQACERRTGWPMGTMQDDLRKEWAKAAEGKIS
ncbi:uncharacterized protein BDW70DRAFT_171160 [Aspergillus foveolatus]|uniref:uncharacterized protein n=1 Tax=Aspergillus foveolatus TaxID=210207 RepID=UPI003CCD531F